MLEVIEDEARLWPNTAALRGVSDGRERKLQRSPVSTFWIVVVDEIPGWWQGRTGSEPDSESFLH